LGRSKRTFKRRLWQFLFLLLGAGALVTFRFPEKIGIEKPATVDRFAVSRVLDGDTFLLAGGDKVRLLSIDTPEERETLHDEAKSFLEDMINGKSVRLEYGKERRDKYGRLLAYVYVDTLFVNRSIVYNGYGNVYLFRHDELSLTQTKELMSAQKSALERKAGIWAIERSSETVYYARERAFRFHRPNCPTLADDPGNLREIATRNEALLQGLSPCRTCHP
jgi:micrococcal nuclease